LLQEGTNKTSEDQIFKIGWQGKIISSTYLSTTCRDWRKWRL